MDEMDLELSLVKLTETRGRASGTSLAFEEPKISKSQAEGHIFLSSRIENPVG